MTIDQLIAQARAQRNSAERRLQDAADDIAAIRKAPTLDRDALGAAKADKERAAADLEAADQRLETLRRDQQREDAASRLANTPAAGPVDAETLRVDLAAKVAERNRIAAQLTQRDDQALRERCESLDAELDVLEQARADMLADQARRGVADQFHPDQPERELVMSTTTTRSRDIYTAERDKRGERSYFGDLFRSQVLNDVGARQRIDAHHGENQRALATGGLAGLVPPDYLIEQAALIARAGRPFANTTSHLELPETGMSLIIPRSTTGSSAAVQSTENSSVSNTDEVWANLTVPVVTIAGQAQVSRQSLERGAPGIDLLVFSDLANAYAAALEQQVLSGSGASGQMLGVFNTSGISTATAFAAAVTAATFQSKVAGQISAVAAGRYLPPSHVAMHPRRWAWLLSLTDSSNRPLVLPAIQGPNNAVASGDAASAYGETPYTLQGLKVVISSQIPTSVGTGPEDQVIVYRAADLLLAENGDGMPTDLRFEQTAGNNLTTTLVSYGYSAFTAGRYPAAVGVIGGNAGTAGNGLIAPTF